MNMVNPNYNMNSIRFNAQQNTGRQVRIPEYYVVDTDEKKDLREQLKSNPFTSIGYEFFLRGTEHPIPTLLTWLSLSFGLDAYQKSCGGEYDKSLLKKVSTVGDNIENSAFIKSRPVQFVLDGFRNIRKGGNKLMENSAVLRAIFHTPSMPEWGMVKQELLPHRLKVCEDFFHITDSLHLADDAAIPIKNVVIRSEEKEALKAFFGSAKITETEKVNFVLLKQLGKTDDEIRAILNMGAKATEATKTEIRKSLNNISKEGIKILKEEISNGDLLGKHAYESVLDAVKSGAGKVKVRAGHYGFFGPLTRPFERVIACDEIYNKLWSMSDGAKTGTGRFLSKILQMSHRGLTFGQGKLGLLLLIAPSLVEVGRDVAKAEPEEKVGTAVNGLVESISWVFTFPAALHIMHAFGGIQYAGMTQKQVGQYRKIINDFNEANKAGQFATKEVYNEALKEAKRQLKNIAEPIEKNQNFFTKGLKKIARAFTMDLETFKAYEGQNFFMKKIHQLPNFFKNCFGVPVRFGVWTVISSFVLGGLLTKATSMLFGKAYDSMKHEENKENRKAQKKFLKEDLNERLYKTQAAKQMPKGAVTRPMILDGAQTVTRGNAQVLNSQAQKEEQVDNYTYIPSSENVIPSPIGKNSIDTYTHIPSQENTLKKDDTSNPNNRKYVPSQRAANIQKTWDNSGLASALQRADKAEARAMKVLSGNFDGMV